MNVNEMPPRVVIDTNVCLDLFVFRDARWKALLCALEEGRWQAVTRADCREEWHRVLRYPQFRVDDAQYRRMVSVFDALFHALPMDPADAPDPSILPRCADPDDQKFLELALQSDANVLISKDKALLKLARRHRRAGLFAILAPDAWVATCGRRQAP